MQVGIDSFVASISDASRSVGELGVERVQQMREEVELADRSGVDVYGIGEHHREEYIASSPAVLLAAAASRTEKIRLTSAVTVLSSDDPVRVFQDFATLDLISKGRAEIVVGRGSFTESYPLFGFDLQHYDELFAEKLDLLLKLRDQTRVHWKGEHRASLTGQGVWPRPAQAKLPIRLGVGGTPQSFVRAGVLGLPLTVAIIGGEAYRFKPLIDMYREAGARAGHAPESLDVAVHGIGFLADTDKEAAETMYPAHKAAFDKIGRERGWPPQTRASYDAQVSERGAFFVGSPETVARKMWSVSDALGGVSRITLMMSGGPLAHAGMLRAIELLGTKVRPMVNAAQSSSLRTKGAVSDNPCRSSPSNFTSQLFDKEILMKRILATALVAFSLSGIASAEDTSKAKLNERIANAHAVLHELMATPDKGIPFDIASHATCVAVIPGFKKGAFLVGAQYGQGVATCRTGHGWSAPVFVQITGASFGLQAGGQSTDLVLVGVNHHSMDDMLREKVKLGGDIAAAAGPIGRNSEASSGVLANAEFLTYSRSKGLFAGVDLTGDELNQNQKDTSAYYGSVIPYQTILSGSTPTPLAAKHFIATVNELFKIGRARQ